jgi:hypothetical protein
MTPDEPLAEAIIRTIHLVPPSADEVRIAVGDPFEPTPEPQHWWGDDLPVSDPQDPQ